MWLFAGYSNLLSHLQTLYRLKHIINTCDKITEVPKYPCPRKYRIPNRTLGKKACMYHTATARKVLASSETINYRGGTEYYAKRRSQADYFSVRFLVMAHCSWSSKPKHTLTMRSISPVHNKVTRSDHRYCGHRSYSGINMKKCQQKIATTDENNIMYRS